MGSVRALVPASLAALALLVTAACGKDAPPAGAPGPGQAQAAPAAGGSVTKDPAKARTMLAAGAVVVDVRTPGEFAEGHLPQAINIPHDQLGGRLAEVEKLAGGDKARPVVVYCASGNRAKGAVAALRGAGFADVVNGGGLDDLQ